MNHVYAIALIGVFVLLGFLAIAWIIKKDMDWWDKEVDHDA